MLDEKTHYINVPLDHYSQLVAENATHFTELSKLQRESNGYRIKHDRLKIQLEKAKKAINDFDFSKAREILNG